jgi:hypothetical protein
MIRDMSDGGLIKLRSLPDGTFQKAQEGRWEDNILHLVLPDGEAGPAPGVLVEIKSESKLYLGEVRQGNGSAMKILVEHSLDLARLASLQDTWK